MSKWKDIIIEYAFSAGVGIVVGLVIIAAENFQVQMLQLLVSSAAIGIVIGFFCRTGSVIILNKLRKKPIWAFLAISLISGLCTIMIFFVSGERNLLRYLLYVSVVEILVMPMTYASYRYRKTINLQLKKKEEELLSAFRK
jgi:amino acid transporter